MEQRSCIYRLRSAEIVQSQEALAQANEMANEQASASNIHLLAAPAPLTWCGRAMVRARFSRNRELQEAKGVSHARARRHFNRMLKQLESQ